MRTYCTINNSYWVEEELLYQDNRTTKFHGSCSLGWIKENSINADCNKCVHRLSCLMDPSLERVSYKERIDA